MVYFRGMSNKATFRLFALFILIVVILMLFGVAHDMGNSEDAIFAGKHLSDNELAQENFRVQNRLVVTTVWLVFVGAFQIVVLLATMGAILSQESATKNSERAWIVVSVDWQDGPGKVVEIWQSDIPGTAVAISYAYSNQGKTPAWIIERRIRFQIVDKVPKRPGHSNDVQDEVEALGAGGESEHPVLLESNGRVDETGKIGLVHGYVKYRDIFGDIHKTTFGYSTKFPEVLLGKKFERISLPTYNENT